jgi:hypothetical protein
MGMGGSSLAPEFRESWAEAGLLDLAIVDGTGAVSRASLDLKRTSSSSPPNRAGRWDHLPSQVLLQPPGGSGPEAGHFFITDADSILCEIAAAQGFRHCFLNDPTVGGRYSALSLVGLIPAALIGMDMGGFAGRAAVAAEGEFAMRDTAGEESGAFLGALLGLAMRGGTNSFILLVAPSATGSSSSPSTGKEGKGSCRLWRRAADRLRRRPRFVASASGGPDGEDERLIPRLGTRHRSG